ncbi:MAG: class I SAM-dependent methyltransferase [Candidatus Aenigmatarchaeota archaeon]|nr:MAG: class I SAM-dependent methyltransferase [Candidatus Aenigmarchaeota archaeon]
MRSETHRIIIGLVPEGSRVLDVGCSTGLLGKELKKKGCYVVGVEPGESAREAKKHLDKVLNKKIEDVNLRDKFDVIVFSDALEHLPDPEMVLKKLKKNLEKDGFVVASIPNVANWRVRFSLLLGRFDYKDYGICDRTHLRFYTRNTSLKLFRDSNYEVLKVIPAGRLIRRIRILPGLFATHFIIIAR